MRNIMKTCDIGLHVHVLVVLIISLINADNYIFLLVLRDRLIPIPDLAQRHHADRSLLECVIACPKIFLQSFNFGYMNYGCQCSSRLVQTRCSTIGTKGGGIGYRMYQNQVSLCL
jgi:hypothetical protein